MTNLLVINNQPEESVPTDFCKKWVLPCIILQAYNTSLHLLHSA